MKKLRGLAELPRDLSDDWWERKSDAAEDAGSACGKHGERCALCPPAAAGQDDSLRT